MSRLTGGITLLGLLSAHAAAQDPPVRTPSFDRSRYTIGGFLETRPTVLWLDSEAALYKLRGYASASPKTTTQLNQQLLLDASWRRESWSVTSRSVLDGNRSDGDWSTRATSYEAYVSYKPSPSFTFDAGKKRMNWGKGYVWNPVAFVDRPKNPDDPTLAQEGFVVASADYIRSFGGRLQTLSITPVLLPVYERVNDKYGRTGRLNLAAKVYVLLYDTDIDLLILTGGSRPGRIGADVSRNVTSNLEIHGELTRTRKVATSTIDRDGITTQAQRDATNAVLGLRYLTPANTTLIVDYSHAGAGFTPAEMREFVAFSDAAYDAYTASGDATKLMQAAKVAGAAYGTNNPMRDYWYVRASQQDALGVLYFTPAVYAVLNGGDHSFSLTQEMLYRAFTNLEFRSHIGLISGARGSEFGEKPGDLRMEVRVRYYF